jgi:hypothetical protein
MDHSLTQAAATIKTQDGSSGTHIKHTIVMTQTAPVIPKARTLQSGHSR